MKRQKHSLSNYRLLTGDMGKLYPVQLQEILPGDSMKASSAALIRVSPLVAPVMHPVTVRLHHWFVPHRLTWDSWEDFITGGSDGQNDDLIPTYTIGANYDFNELYDYLGIPHVQDIEVNALPVRAYNLIFNEFYRDQDLVDPRQIADSTIAQIAWEKDYFTTSRPFPQKGPDITIPLGTQAPVIGIGKLNQTYNQTDTSVYESGGVDNVYASSGAFGTETHVRQDPDNPGYPGIYADLTEATAANVNEWRRAFALQRYQEARMRYGSRYSEYLRYLGVTPSDARLQRPEYLGGGKATINFSEVLQTQRTDTGESPQGNMAGHGIAAVRTRNFVRHFNEHGYMMTLMSVRPKTVYEHGMDRTLLRQTKEDFWQMELQQIGQQAVLNNEVYADPTTGGETFGYQDRYAEYKHTPSRVCGEFRDLLNYWHMARIFDSAPALNEEFVTCDPTKRIHAEQTQHSLWCMVNNVVKSRRFVKKSASSRIL